MTCKVVKDIEQEYSDYVSNIWQEMSNISKHSLQHPQRTEQLYGAISVASIQFLQEKLKALEEENRHLSTD